MDSFDLRYYVSELKKRYTPRMLFMCLGVWKSFCLERYWITWGRSLPWGSGGRTKLLFFLAEPVFKIGSLSLFSTDPMFRYHEALKFWGLRNTFASFLFSNQVLAYSGVSKMTINIGPKESKFFSNNVLGQKFFYLCNKTECSTTFLMKWFACYT